MKCALLVALFMALAADDALACPYPQLERRLEIEGTVVLDVTVAVDGSVKDVRVIQSSGNQDLDDAAVACWKTYRYKPAMQDGHPVEAHIKSQMVWTLKDPDPPETKSN